MTLPPGSSRPGLCSAPHTYLQLGELGWLHPGILDPAYRPPLHRTTLSLTLPSISSMPSTGTSTTSTRGQWPPYPQNRATHREHTGGHEHSALVCPRGPYRFPPPATMSDPHLSPPVPWCWGRVAQVDADRQ